MSLGDAFVTVRADTTKFNADLAKKMQTALAAAKPQGVKLTGDASQAIKATEDLKKAQLAANKEALADWKRTTKEIEAAESEAYAHVAAGAQSVVAAQKAANAEALADWIRTSKEIEAAEREAYAQVAAAARASASDQIASSRKVAAANALAAAESKAAFDRSFGGSFKNATKGLSNPLGSLGKSLGEFSANIPSDIFGAITTSAKFAAIGVVGLGAALAGIGLVAASKQQAALVGFTALADQIGATTDKASGLNVALTGLSQQEETAIGRTFLNRLIDLSNNSALAQGSLQDVTQQLLALEFNGDQSIGIVKDIGNALAASGKQGADLNEGLKGVVTAFAQIKSAGRLLAQDLNQITTRIPGATRTKVYRQLAIDLGLAGANAKKGTPEFLKMNREVQKLAKEGKIGADTAIGSITKVLEEVPGAARDAATGLDALGRQNLTLSGRFEALKDNVRSALARAFLLPGEGGAGKSLADRFADQIGAAIPVITSTLAKIGPGLSDFVSKFGGIFLEIIPEILSKVGEIFTLISDGITAATTQGNPLNDFFVGLKNTFEGLIPIIQLAFDLLLPALAALGPLFRIFGDGIKILGDVAGAVRKVLRPLTLITSGAIFTGLHLIADAFDLAASAAGSLAGVADTIQKKFIDAINFVLDKVKGLIRALDFHVGPIHIEVPGADAAIAKIDAIQAGLDSIPASVTSVVNILVNPIDSRGGIISGGTLNGQTVHDSEATRALAAQKSVESTADELRRNAKRQAQGIADDVKKKVGGGASSAANAFRDKIKEILLGLNADFVHTLTEGTGKAISGALTSLRKAIAAAFKGKNTKVDDQLVKLILTDNTKLRALAVERDKVADTLKKATDKVAEVTNAVKQFAAITSVDFSKIADGVRKINTETLDIAGSFAVTSRSLKDSSQTATDAVQHSGEQFAQALAARLTAIQDFQKNIDILVRRGLNKNIIDQIIGAGIEGGSETANALANASDDTIDAIKKTENAIDDAARKLGNTAADSLFRAGTDVVSGLVAGLKDRKSEIALAMSDIAKELIKQIRKDLKVHSPSRVMRELFQFVGDGAVLGLDDSVKGVGAAGSRLAGAAMPGFSASVPGARNGGSGGGITSADIDRVVAAVAGARPNKEIHAPQTFHVQTVTSETGDQFRARIARR